ncbi:hypothetical protein [Comamonas jiangduensis]|jgi:hypothetical protein|uniref:hypothetical protein n=1 Tax=Comamonas jiangduensis TaxID=1194168 RepID=UPI0035231588
MSLVKKVEELTNEYVRKGGKDNRMQQRSRMLAFAAHASTLGAREMGQVGAMHVVRYWKAHRHLADSTLKQHWHAIQVLWVLSGKAGEPPLPWKKKPLEAPLSLKEKLFGRGDGG